ncbi:MAG: hypothetical protein IJP09_02980 [Clostridia bacterium]|nr:hypothetical protein [Clostridia bacterium]
MMRKSIIKIMVVILLIQVFAIPSFAEISSVENNGEYIKLEEPLTFDELISLLQDTLLDAPDGMEFFFSDGKILVQTVNGYIKVFDSEKMKDSNVDERLYHNVPINSYFNTYKVRNVEDIIGYRMVSNENPDTADVNLIFYAAAAVTFTAALLLISRKRFKQK